jgi:bifunctional UDP-N-acetylglucosamine pyrophosphorylase/glucosamine-1-phosphate N-acetyltransferase
MNRLMIIPAAGLGSRLGSTVPKVLVPVNGKPMIDYLLDLYAPMVERFILILNPSFASEVIRYCAERALAIDYETQETPTGMLDAILIPRDRIRTLDPTGVWITWCDQIAVHPETIKALKEAANQNPDTALIFPTIERTDPYIHLVRNDRHEIVDILHRREGDHLPEVGESDMGLFCLSRKAYLELLPQFSRHAGIGAGTYERNFLPFISWLLGRADVKTFPGRDETESIGINTPAELRRVEHYFRNK